MRLIYRRLLLVFSVLVFFVITPLIVFYAMGYRYRSDQVKPVSVGVILLTSLPTRSQVYLDGELQGRTPRALSNLLPGKVTVRVQKEGYKDWEKRIDVEPAKAININTVHLFPKVPKTIPLASNVTTFELSPNKKLIAVLDTKNQISVLDSEGVSVVKAVKLKSQPQEIMWSPDSSMVLLHTATRWDVLPVADLGTLTPLVSLSNASTVVWDPRTPGRLLAITPDNTLIASEINNPVVATLKADVEKIVMGPRAVYVLNSSNIIQRLNFDGEVIETVAPLPQGQIQEIRISPRDTLAVVADRTGIWLLTSEDRWQQISQHGLDALWSPSGEMLLLQTAPNELSIYTDSNEFQYLPSGQMQLISRLSRALSHIDWFISDSHVLYQLDDQIVVGEVDARDYAIQTTLDSTNTSNAEASVGDQSESIYYLKKTAEQTQLVKSELVVLE